MRELPTPRQVARRVEDDPAAAEVLAIAEWATELSKLCDHWLAGRERLRAAQAEVAEAREHRAHAELSRGDRHGAGSLPRVR